MIEDEFWNQIGVKPEQLPDWKVEEKLDDGRFGVAHYTSSGEKTIYWGTIEQCSASLGALAKYRVVPIENNVTHLPATPPPKPIQTSVSPKPLQVSVSPKQSQVYEIQYASSISAEKFWQHVGVNPNQVPMIEFVEACGNNRVLLKWLHPKGPQLLRCHMKLATIILQTIAELGHNYPEKLTALPQVLSFRRSIPCWGASSAGG